MSRWRGLRATVKVILDKVHKAKVVAAKVVTATVVTAKVVTAQVVTAKVVTTNPVRASQSASHFAFAFDDPVHVQRPLHLL